MTAVSKTKAPRRTAQESDEFRARIITVARALFSEEGFDAVSIRKITQRAGCPTMTFYVFFPSKRALLRHIWEDVFSDLFETCRPILEGAGGPESRLAALVRAIIAYWLARPDSYRLVFMNQDEVGAVDEAYYVQSSGIRERFQIINDLIVEGITAGVFETDDVEASAQLILATMIGVTHALVTIPEFPWAPEALIDHAVRALVGGLEPGRAVNRS
jgi:AcrR family transcriptional regulator